MGKNPSKDLHTQEDITDAALQRRVWPENKWSETDLTLECSSSPTPPSTTTLSPLTETHSTEHTELVPRSHRPWRRQNQRGILGATQPSSSGNHLCAPHLLRAAVPLRHSTKLPPPQPASLPPSLPPPQLLRTTAPPLLRTRAAYLAHLLLYSVRRRGASKP
ncbi:hypothetical protein U1Q18_016378 [Sarracenia purpurea var. burkii]